jgi:hypothetical protein
MSQTDTPPSDHAERASNADGHDLLGDLDDDSRVDESGDVPAGSASPGAGSSRTVRSLPRLDDAAFEALVRRLSEQSVLKNYDAYADIPWDDPGYAVDPDDPRWELSPVDGLGATEWYRSQPPGVRSRIGLYRTAAAAKVGLQFENVLKRGLLEMAFEVDNNDPVFRYLYHEVIEEAHHGLMFQEFVNRSGFDIRGLPRFLRIRSRIVVRMGRQFPELFFVFVLGGEDPIDHVQRERLRSGDPMPPIIATIMRHHVIEEARHISFARNLLMVRVPRLPAWKRHWMAVQIPIILGTMAAQMLQPPKAMAREFGIPDEVMKTAFADDGTARQIARDSVRMLRQMSRDLGLINPVSLRLWKRLQIWDED